MTHDEIKEELIGDRIAFSLFFAGFIFAALMCASELRGLRDRVQTLETQIKQCKGVK